MVQHSGAAIYKNATVSSITQDPKKRKGGSSRYRISTKDTANLTATAENFPVSFDNIIIASPWQFSNIDADEKVIHPAKSRQSSDNDADKDITHPAIEEIPYMKLHVTLFTSPFTLRPGFFGLKEDAKAPSNVYTTLAASEVPHLGPDGVGRTGFYSISTLRTVTNPQTGEREFVYKIFSPAPVTAAFLSDVLGATVPEGFTSDGSEQHESTEQPSPISWYHPTWFHSYPLGLPRVTFQDPVVGDGVYYTSGIEGFISTMETSALMGMNVARLIADEFAGVERTAEGRKPADNGEGEGEGEKSATPEEL